jgi:hypothetical protein
MGEALEGRQLLTGGAGSIFALVPGQVAAAKQPAAHTFTIKGEDFTLPRSRSMTLGIDIAPAGGSAIQPKIASVVNAKGKAQPITYPTGGVLKTKAGAGAVDAQNGAVLVPIRNVPASGVSLTTRVVGEGDTTGGFLLGYYLPGDANGDGVVEQADIQIVTSSLGSIVGDTNYVFDADANRDGRVGMNDLTLARQNLGAKTTILPVLSANLDPISDSGTPDRTTVYQQVVFTGQGTPGATITYTEATGKTPAVTTTALADGRYQLTAGLAEGANTFLVTAADRFGQVISGKIAPVTYLKPLTEVASPTKPPLVETPKVTEDTSKTPKPSKFPNRVATPADQAARLRELRAARQNDVQLS